MRTQWSYFSPMEHLCAASQVSLAQDMTIHIQDWWPVEEMEGAEIVSHSVEDNGPHHILCYIHGDIIPPGHQHNMEQYLWVVAVAVILQQKC